MASPPPPPPPSHALPRFPPPPPPLPPPPPSLLFLPRPQLSLLGSDGRSYTFLAKPKDDLRKDNRMMEAAGVINRLFAGDPAARRRNLYLRWAAGGCARACVCVCSGGGGVPRGWAGVDAVMVGVSGACWCCHCCFCPPTLRDSPAPPPPAHPRPPSPPCPARRRRFAVLPIGEDNGIVEWVLHTTGLRHCLTDAYSAAGLFDARTNRTIQKIWDGAPPVGGLPGVAGWAGWGGGGRLGGGVGWWWLGWGRQGERAGRVLYGGTVMCLLADTKAARDAPHPYPHPPHTHARLPQTKRRAEVLDEVLRAYPPLFHRWLLGRFTEPAAWLSARLAYTRTAGKAGADALSCLALLPRTPHHTTPALATLRDVPPPTHQPASFAASLPNLQPCGAWWVTWWVWATGTARTSWWTAAAGTWCT